MSIFDKRVSFKPFEYPEVIKFQEAINHSYWLVSEWNFISDVQDFNVNLSPIEKNAIRNTLLAISQIEVSVKKFWIKLGDKLPKPEIDQVGITFGESEIRHMSGYSHLLQVLGLNKDFESLLEIPVIQGRIDYLTKYLKNASDNSNENYTLTLALFSLFIENISLFSQFAIIKSINKHKNYLKDIDNVVSATFLEEEVHAQFGIYIINQIKKEFPEWFNQEFYDKIYRAARKGFDAESKIIDWIFENGELEYISKITLNEFIKSRFNESIMAIGGHAIFEIDKEELKKIQWFNHDIYASVNTDFFHKKPVTYTRKSQPIQASDLF